MPKRIFTFRDFISEQETKDTKPTKGDPTKKEDPAKKGEDEKGGMFGASGLAAAMFQSALDKLGFKDNNFSEIAETPETKGGLPITSCGSTPYAFKPIEATNQEIIDMFKTGQYSTDIRYSEITRKLNDGSKEIFVLGVREDLDVKKKEGDKFIDKIAIIDPNKPTDKVVSYQATTTPSVDFYSDPQKSMSKKGVAIMLPGVVDYKVGIHRPNSSFKHEALIQAGQMDIERFPLNAKGITTYTPDPATKETGEEYGINIHKSSKDRGICVGAYSAGCQVFADGKDFEDFMAKIKEAKQPKYPYVLIQNDDIAKAAPPPAPGADKGADKEAAAEDSLEKTEMLAGLVKSLHDQLDTWGHVNREDFINTWNSSVKSKEDAKGALKLYQKTYNEDISNWFTSDKMSEDHLKAMNFLPN
jgi:hypothetical protein